MESPPPLVLTRSVSRGIPRGRSGSSSSVTTAASQTDFRKSNADDEELGERPGFLQRVVSNTAPIVPRKRRRGLFANLSLVPEVERPMEYAFRVKVVVTCVVAAAGASAPMASGILYPGLGDITKEFGGTDTVTNLTVALYMLGMAIFPLWWSSFAERTGYRTIFIISFTLYVLSNVCGALSINIGMLIAFRIFSGASAASAQSIGAGVIANIWATKQRGEAMGYFYLGPLCGPLLAPVLGGALTQTWGWRSTQWFLAIFGLTVLLLIILALPETLPRRTAAPVLEKPDTEETPPPLTLSRTITHLSTHAKTHLSLLKLLLVDPLRSLLFLRFPPVFLTVLYASTAFGSLFILNVAIQKTFSSAPYSFPSVTVGLMYIPGALGNIISSIIGGRWNDAVMARAASKRLAEKYPDTNPPEDAVLEYRPEDRMSWNAVLAGCLFPSTLLMFGWASEYGVHWAVGAVATGVFGLGAMLVFSMALTMLTEFVPGRSSSAVAVNNFVRNITSCVGSIVVAPIMNAIGVGWLFTIVAVLGYSMLSIVWVMKKYGPRWREDVEKYRKYM